MNGEGSIGCAEYVSILFCWFAGDLCVTHAGYNSYGRLAGTY